MAQRLRNDEQRGSENSKASVDSVTSSFKSLMAHGLRAAGDLTGLEFLDDTALKKYGPEQLLSRMLSTKTYISTDSSQAARDQDLHNSSKETARHVGEGQCGIVYAMQGADYVIKLAKPAKDDQLFNDWLVHKMLEETFSQLQFKWRPDINIPRLGEWVHPTNEQFWKGHLSSFPAGTKENYGLVSTRIFPLPEPARKAMFKAFAPSEMSKSSTRMAALLTEARNKDCLVRIYLGRRMERKPTDNFKLRNFELLVNEAEWLRLNTEEFADTMGRTLAVLHWKVGVDANDVEFVLGSSPMIKPSATAAEYRERDFNQCKVITRSTAGVKTLIDGFIFNDPYYPRPGSKDVKDQILWDAFKAAYLDTSEEMLRMTNGQMSIAEAFINGVEQDKRIAGGGIGGGLF